MRIQIEEIFHAIADLSVEARAKYFSNTMSMGPRDEKSNSSWLSIRVPPDWWRETLAVWRSGQWRVLNYRSCGVDRTG